MGYFDFSFVSVVIIKLFWNLMLIFIFKLALLLLKLISIFFFTLTFHSLLGF